MNSFKIAARNILRNVRRSLMTIMAIAVGTSAMLLFGEFVSQLFVSLETQAVSRSGHIAVYHEGYFQYGAGNPAAYGIKDYQIIIKLFSEDPVLHPLINVVTPMISLFGIAGNFDAEASKTFYGLGVVPESYNRMRIWDEHGLKFASYFGVNDLNQDDETHGFVGIGLARILGLCEALHLDKCRQNILPNQAGDQAVDQKPSDKAAASAESRDFSGLEEKSDPAASKAVESRLPRLDLLVATAAGAPNVVSFYVDKAVYQGIKELDDSAVMMNFDLAQNLLYGRGEKKAVGIILQLHRTEDMAIARGRLDQLIKDKGLQLETRDLEELQPFYKQAVRMFKVIFSFISMVMGVIVLFTIVNTMSMSVMERTHEIGTLRAMGVKRKGITTQFVIEGGLLGLIGASVGLVVGSVLAQVVNHAGLMWLPPGQSAEIPLVVLTQGVGRLMFGIWFGLGLLATIAAWIPARRAARMKIVDALGHI